ncbi:MAG: nucleoside hydrolase [Burkholderiaceae bacterium]
MSMPMVKWVLIVIGTLTLLVVTALSMPVQLWRTGEVPQPELRYSPPSQKPATPARVWIDADAACGTGKRRDPDDCLALLSLASASHVDIAGISTVFGNAPVDKTDQVMRELVKEIGTHAGRPVSAALPVFKGCGAAAPRCLEDGGSLDAQAALRQALQRGPLDVVMLGPLTNLAAVLAAEPALASRITRVIAVMGRRPGHRFHPSENRATGAMLFGHGPIFRDLNAVLDTHAVSVVLASGIPMVLVPYTAARQVSLTGSDLDRVARTGPAGRWVAERSRAWLEFWRSEGGLAGFYPFDLMAAAYVRNPAQFACARVTAWVGDDALLPWFGGGPALLVAQPAGPPVSATVTAQALYCEVARVSVDELFL